MDGLLPPLPLRNGLHEKHFKQDTRIYAKRNVFPETLAGDGGPCSSGHSHGQEGVLHGGKYPTALSAAPSGREGTPPWPLTPCPPPCGLLNVGIRKCHFPWDGEKSPLIYSRCYFYGAPSKAVFFGKYLRTLFLKTNFWNLSPFVSQESSKGRVWGFRFPAPLFQPIQL